MKKILKYFGIFIATNFLFFGISAIFTINDCGLEWEKLLAGQECASFAYPTLLLYRFLIYLVPAFIWIFVLKLRKQKFIDAIIIGFNYQFISYAITAAIWEMFALDYLLHTKLFASMNAYVLIIGLILAATGKISYSLASYNKKSKDN